MRRNQAKQERELTDKEKRLGLLPLDPRGYTGSMFHARRNRMGQIEQMFERFVYGDEQVLTAALARASQKEWFQKAHYWRKSSGDWHRPFYDMLRSDKEFWIGTAKGHWGYLAFSRMDLVHAKQLLDCPHEFTRAELLPLVAHSDPNVRAVGLRLTAMAKRVR